MAYRPASIEAEGKAENISSISSERKPLKAAVPALSEEAYLYKNRKEIALWTAEQKARFEKVLQTPIKIEPLDVVSSSTQSLVSTCLEIDLRELAQFIKIALSDPALGGI